LTLQFWGHTLGGDKAVVFLLMLSPPHNMGDRCQIQLFQSRTCSIMIRMPVWWGFPRKKKNYKLDSPCHANSEKENTFIYVTSKTNTYASGI
jgi:hypothetical protein